jgi:hypothetical protein
MIRTTQVSFRQLAFARTTPRAAATASSLLSNNNSQSQSSLQSPQDGSSTISRRWNYQVFLTRTKDRKTGTYTYGDWDYLMKGIQEPETWNGDNLAERYFWEEEHIKPTEANRRLNADKKYERSRQHVDDLTSYIQFVTQDKQDIRKKAKALKKEKKNLSKPEN